MLQALPLVFVLVGVVLYTVLGGADLGAGYWQLADRNDSAVREYAHGAMAPVWEANHVWLIFVLTVFWSAYPEAFGSIASTLAVPLFIALLGLVFRGAAYALRAGAATPSESARVDTVFSISSILVPFALGAAIGGIATNRVPVGNAAGDLWSSWLNVTSILTGLLAVATSAYLAAVYLATDASRDDERTLERKFRVRALGSGMAAGVIAVAGVFIVDADNHELSHSLSSGRALPAVVLSGAAGLATLILVYRRRYEWARYSAALAVATVAAGWALARWPTILPNLTVHQAAVGRDALICLVAAVLAGAAILSPALALLLRLTLTGRFRAVELTLSADRPRRQTTTSTRSLGRLGVAALIVGVGLLNVAEASWAHAVGVACLLGFVVLGFVAIGVPVLDREATSQ